MAKDKFTNTDTPTDSTDTTPLIDVTLERIKNGTYHPHRLASYNPHLVSCYSCQAQVAKTAHICPKCGAKLKNTHLKRNIFLIVLGLVIVSAIYVNIIYNAIERGNNPHKVDPPAVGELVDTNVGANGDTSGDTNSPTTSPTTSPAPTPTPTTEPTTTTSNPEPNPIPDVFDLGDRVGYSGVYVTFLSITRTPGSEFNQPAQGKEFVICEFMIENESAEDLTIAMSLSFESYCDDFTTPISFSSIMESDKATLDGPVAAGKKMKGIIGYELPIGWNELEIRFSPNMLKNEKIIFLAVNPSVASSANSSATSTT